MSWHDEFDGPGSDVHVVTSAHAINTYMEQDRSGFICFRCGEQGHLRYQCLTHKVRLCWHFQRGECTERYCSFAHGEQELRTPWRPRCVRVIKQDGTFVCVGCNSTEHTFRRCPRTQGLALA